MPEFVDALRAVSAVVGTPHGIVAHSLGCAATTLALREGLQAERLVYFAPPLEPIDYTVRFCAAFGLDEQVAADMQRRIETRSGIPPAYAG